MVKLIMWLFMPSDSPNKAIYSPFKALKQGDKHE
jgi:hypothetical protein